MQETWVWSLGWDDPLEEEMATHSGVLPWRIPIDRGTWWAIVHAVAESDMTEQLNTAYSWVNNSAEFLLRGWANSLSDHVLNCSPCTLRIYPEISWLFVFAFALYKCPSSFPRLHLSPCTQILSHRGPSKTSGSPQTPEEKQCPHPLLPMHGVCLCL